MSLINFDNAPADQMVSGLSDDILKFVTASSSERYVYGLDMDWQFASITKGDKEKLKSYFSKGPEGIFNILLYFQLRGRENTFTKETCLNSAN